MGCSGVGLAGGFVYLYVKSSHPENPDVILLKFTQSDRA